MGLLCSKTFIDKSTSSDKRSSAGRESSSSSNTSQRALAAKRSQFVKTNSKRWQDDYVLKKTLGAGITGSVHLVQRIGTDDLFAKKSINVDDQDPAQLEELRNEIALLRELDHPNIVHLYECYEHDQQIHLVMENCEGGELFERFRHGSLTYHNFTEDEISKICFGALSALSYCHSKGIVHRDLKPQNIVFPKKDNLEDIKIIDFGMSKKGMKRTIFGRRAIQTACGTPLYVAPEIICGARYDEKIDVWAIGVLAYHMAIGRHPFQGRDQDETLDNIEKHKAIQFKGKKWREKSPVLKSFIDLLLKPKISSRPSASDALRHPFLAGEIETVDTPARLKLKESASETFEKMKAFSSYPDIKRAALMAIAHKLHTNEIGGLREAFQKIDTKHTGTIDRSEFQELSNNFDSEKLSEEELSAIFDAADIDNSGQIAYGEFLAATLDTNVFLREDRLRDAFNLLDEDSSGTITYQNLRSLLGDEFDIEEIELMIAQVDAKHNGVIDFEEFLLLMRGNAQEEELSNLLSPTKNVTAVNESDVEVNVVEEEQEKETEQETRGEETEEKKEKIEEQEEKKEEQETEEKKDVIDTADVADAQLDVTEAAEEEEENAAKTIESTETEETEGE